MRVLTLAEIHAATRTQIPYLTGAGWFRRVSGREYLKHMPAPLEDTEGEPKEARAARVEEWAKLHADAIAEGQVQLVALASIEPRLTVDDVRALGNEVPRMAQALFAFSFPAEPEAPPA